MADLLDNFTGVWDLDPSTLDYQHGRPGRRAVYTIVRTPEGLEFTLDADDADGKPMHFTYGGELDGEFRGVPGFPVTAAMSLLPDGSIESLGMKDGVVIDRWTRTLNADRTAILICQHSVPASGKTFVNSALYRRRA